MLVYDRGRRIGRTRKRKRANVYVPPPSLSSPAAQKEARRAKRTTQRAHPGYLLGAHATPKEARQAAAAYRLYHPPKAKPKKPSEASVNRLISQAVAHPIKPPKTHALFSPWTAKHPLEGMLGSQRNAITALALLRQSDPKRYDARLRAADKRAKAVKRSKQGVSTRMFATVNPVHIPGKYVRAVLHGGGSTLGYIYPKAAVGGALELSGRPGRAVAGGTEAAVKGKNVHHAITRAFEGKEHKTFADVFNAAGWRPKSDAGKLLLAGAALGADIGFDPLTYTGAGLISPAESVARRVALVAGKQAGRAERKRVATATAERGFSRRVARKAGRRAGRRARPKAREDAYLRSLQTSGERTTRGPEIRFAGRRVGGKHQARATSKVGDVGRGAARAAERIPKVGPKLGAARLRSRQIAAAANATVRPVGLTREEFNLGRRIRRERRAGTAIGAQQASQRAHSIAHLVTPEEHVRFGEAIEAGDLGRLANAPKIKLKRRATGVPVRPSTRTARRYARQTAESPERLQTVARHYSGDIDRLHAELQQAGVKIGDIKRTAPPKRLTGKIGRTQARLTEHRERAAAVSARARQVAAKARTAKTPERRQELEELALRLRKRSQNLGRKAAAAKTRLGELNAELDDVMALRPKGYVPRVRKETVEKRGPANVEDIISEPKQYGRGGEGSKAPKPPQAHRRTVQNALEVLRKGSAEERAYVEQFTHDPALSYQAYMAAGTKRLAQARANHELFAHGTPVQHGQPLLDTLQQGERVYTRDPVHTANLREIDHRTSEGRAEVARIEQGHAKVKGNDYVVLPKALHDYVNAAEEGQLGKIGTAWTYAWNKWKSAALKTPSYLMRNLTGDLFNALGAQDPGRLAVNWLHGQRALNARARSALAYKWFADEAAKQLKTRTVEINGRTFTYEQIAALAEATGAINAGRLADVAEVAAQTRKLRPKGTRAWQQLQDRVEHSARMGTFIGALKRGETPEKAADLVRDMHFDYGELTKFEKHVRSLAMPFYTFSARNIPLQAKLLATRPGLAAGYESARQEGRKQAGLPEDYLKGLDPYEAKQFGIPIKWRGKIYTVSSGAPITDLRALTPVGDPKNLSSWLTLPVAAPTQRGLELLGPYKVVGELLANYSLFYGEAITPDPRTGQADATPVHPLIAKMADTIPGFAKRFGIFRQLDKTSGHDVWSWSRKKEYALNSALPGPYGAVVRSSRNVAGPRGFSPVTEALGNLAGVRAKEYVPTKASLKTLNDRFNVLQAQINLIHGAGRNLNYRPTARLRQLQDEQNRIQKDIDRLKRGSQKFYKGQPTSRSQSRSSGGLGGSRSLGGSRGLGGGVSLGGGSVNLGGP